MSAPRKDDAAKLAPAEWPRHRHGAPKRIHRNHADKRNNDTHMATARAKLLPLIAEPG
jgi:hypothetical protein